MKNSNWVILAAFLNTLGVLGCNSLMADQTSAATSSGLPAATSSNLSAIWANDGGDKVTRDEQRATTNPTSVINSVWDGNKIHLFGAVTEVVSFNLVLETSGAGSQNISVVFNQLTGPAGSVIHSVPATKDTLFDFTQRDIELFYVRYLQIKGLSLVSYNQYDERHVPKRFRRPFQGEGMGSGGWKDRPDADKFYPEIAVPLELVPTFNILPGQNQSIWSDIFIPRGSLPGLYTGVVQILQNGVVQKSIPIELTVRGFVLPAAPSSKTMLYFGYDDINQRYLGQTRPDPGTPLAQQAQAIRDKHFMIAHRHRISLVDGNPGADPWDSDRPRPDWVPRLDGTLFSAQNGYRGPGEFTGNGIFAVGAYGSWGWKNEGEPGMQTHLDAWEFWFQQNAADAERFLYLADEPTGTDVPELEKDAGWAKIDDGPGKTLKTFATLALPQALQNVPSLGISASTFDVAPKDIWQNAYNTAKAQGKKVYLYNGKRPAEGSFATEDDGVSLRELPWGQFKKGIDRWFFWESTYYNDYQTGRGQNSLFENALTFGQDTGPDPVVGHTGYNYSNGDGVLFYPGTDVLFPQDSYGVAGPFASLRMKQWRRGIQDVDYLTLAQAIDPVQTQAIVNRMVPKILWENDVSDPEDPTWVRTDISWSTNPDDWEAARAQLADIIEHGKPANSAN